MKLEVEFDLGWPTPHVARDLYHTYCNFVMEDNIEHAQRMNIMMLFVLAMQIWMWPGQATTWIALAMLLPILGAVFTNGAERVLGNIRIPLEIYYEDKQAHQEKYDREVAEYHHAKRHWEMTNFFQDTKKEMLARLDKIGELSTDPETRQQWRDELAGIETAATDSSEKKADDKATSAQTKPELDDIDADDNEERQHSADGLSTGERSLLFKRQVFWTLFSLGNWFSACGLGVTVFSLAQAYTFPSTSVFAVFIGLLAFSVNVCPMLFSFSLHDDDDAENNELD